MKLKYVCFCLLLWGMITALPFKAKSLPADSQQMLLVLTPDWQAVEGKLWRFERQHDQWLPVGSPVPIVVGKNGMGWGRGLFEAADTNGDFRKEGDKRAPAGIFSLGTVFGLASPTQAVRELKLKMPYLELTEHIQCIGDRHSQHYNSLQDIRKVPADWKTSANEQMRQIAIHDEGAYRWGVFIRHNMPENPTGRDQVSGSCIFLHIWKNQHTGTSGCTGMASPQLVSLLQWLDQSKKPLLVQLPLAEYQRLQAKWGLPAVTTPASEHSEPSQAE